jgi:hypothetical protein
LIKILRVKKSRRQKIARKGREGDKEGEIGEGRKRGT